MQYRMFITGAALVLASSSFAKPNPKQTTAQGLRNFGFELMQGLRKSKSKEPIAVSPISLGEALTLVTRGSENKTKQELESLFLTPAEIKSGLGISDLSAGISYLRKDLLDYAKKSNSAFEYTNANALWGNANPQIGFKFTPAFLKLAAEEYGAGLTTEEFGKPAVDHINQWVAKNTKDKIKELLTTLGKDDVAVLLNAVYAKGKFANYFPLLTVGDYTNDEGKKLKATYLTRRHETPFFENKQARLFTVAVGDSDPRGVRDQIALDILVPKSGTVGDLIDSLDGQTYADWVSQAKVVDMELTLPAGKVEQKEALKIKDVLAAKPFGLTLPFDQDLAEFHTLGTTAREENLYISDILAKTFYEVTPFGFEAAAAAAVLVARATSALVEKVPKHEIRTASLHIVRHVPTGTPLFMVAYDSPVEYSNDRIASLVEEGHGAMKNIRAEVKEGTIGISYGDKAPYAPSVALMGKDGKVLKVFKTLKK